MAPILASDRIGVYADWHLLEPSDDYIPAVPMIFVERDAIESEHKRTIPPGDYLCMNYRRGELERYHPSFARLHTYMAEHGWVLNGMIFQFYKIDVTLTSDPDETLMEIQVPVRPRSLSAPPASFCSANHPAAENRRARDGFARKENIES